MKDLDPSVELFIRTQLSQMEKDMKKDRHSQNNKMQNVIINQERKLEDAIKNMQDENAKLLKQVSGLFAKKWVERLVVSVGVFIIAGVSTIFWNVFSDTFTEFLEEKVNNEQAE